MIKIHEEASRCLLCHHGPCTEACKMGQNPQKAIFSIYFGNEHSAGKYLNSEICKDCNGACEKACIHYDFPLRIKELSGEIPDFTAYKPVDLSIDFLGVHLENPFLLSSSIVAGNYEMCSRALQMGWAGIVYKTIGYVQPKEVSPRFDVVGDAGYSFTGFKNLEQISEHPLEENLEILKRLKKEFPTKAIVASIMGQNSDEWAKLSQLVTAAGVDIIECNFSCPHMTNKSMGADVGQHPEVVKKYTAAVCSNTHLPVLAKMTPNLGNMEPSAIAAVEGGASGIAAINTIKSISGLNLNLTGAREDILRKSATSGYSGKAVKPIALRFINDLSGCDKLSGIPISGMGGIESWHDGAEFIALGCGCVQVTTAVMEYGYRIIEDLTDGLSRFMSTERIKSLSELVGSKRDCFVPTDRLNRTTIVYPKFDYEKCVGCGRCYTSCSDGGHQAIDFTSSKPVLNVKKCVGCLLCSLVCRAGAIKRCKRINQPIRK